MNDSVRAFVDWSGEFEELYKFNGQWPKSKEWIGLTEEERLEILGVGGEAAVLYVTEAKLREKNSV